MTERTGRVFVQLKVAFLSDETGQEPGSRLKTFTRRRRSLLRGLLSAAVLGFAGWASQVAGAAETVYPQKSWVEPSPETTGWSLERLKAADDVARSIGTGAYLVVQHGVIVHKFGEVNKPMNLASARKCVLSVLYGIEVDRGKIDLGQTLAELGIEDKGGLSETEKRATVRELLQARSGVYHPAAYETSSMKAERPPRASHEPGTYWYYNNWDFNALRTIFRKLTGSSVFDSLDKELARPLRFEDFDQSRDTEFITERASDHPAYVMRLSVRDLARVGLLMARSGRWGDRQIVSTRWVAESTASYSNASASLGYGYLWWVGQDNWHFRQKFPGKVFSARGNYGQFLVVDPVRDIVIVHRVEMDRLFAREVSVRQFGDLLEQILLAAPTQ